MDAWIEFARGPLFRICLTIMAVGVAYRVGVAVVQIVVAWRGAGDRRLPIADIASATARWLVPVRLLRMSPAYSVASFLLHVGLILVPLFLAGHVALLTGVVPSAWPTLGATSADVLTLIAVVAVLALLAGRLLRPMARQLTRFQDVAVLLLLGATLGAGFLAAHPTVSPFPARTMLLVHILFGNLVLVLIPLSKIAHCVLYPLTQLIFQLGWHFPESSGRHVAIALGKEDEPV